MISVDVFVPYLNVAYDFSLDETAPVQVVLERIAALICLKERWAPPSPTSQLMLFDPASRRCLNDSASLFSAGIYSGKQLILC